MREWGLDAVEIGRVTEDGLVRVLHNGKVAAEIPAHPLAEEGPVYERPLAPPKRVAQGTPIEFGTRGADHTERFSQIAGGSFDSFETLDLGTIRLHGANEYTSNHRVPAMRRWCG